ncbi:hypothetical protein [Nocardia brasiliensis]
MIRLIVSGSGCNHGRQLCSTTGLRAEGVQGQTQSIDNLTIDVV